jgi:hypothetical protein
MWHILIILIIVVYCYCFDVIIIYLYILCTLYLRSEAFSIVLLKPIAEWYSWIGCNLL